MPKLYLLQIEKSFLVNILFLLDTVSTLLLSKGDLNFKRFLPFSTGGLVEG